MLNFAAELRACKAPMSKMTDTGNISTPQRGKLWNGNYIKIWSTNFLLHFSFTLIVPLLPFYLNQTFGADNQMIGVCMAGYTVMAILVRPFSGYIVDSFPRKAVLLLCNFIFVCMFVGYLAAGSLLAFALFRSLHGLPFGAVTVSASTVAIDVLPSDRRAEGIGYYGLSHNLATAIGPVLAISVLSAFGGNFKMLFWLSILSSLLGLILDATLKLPARDFVPEKKAISLHRLILTKGWRESIAIVLMAIAYGILSTYVAIYAKLELNLTSGTGFFFTLFAVGFIISRITGVSNLGRNLVTRNALKGIIASMVGYFVFAAIHSLPAFYASAFIVGLGNGHMWPAFQTMFINLAPHSKRGTANSTIFSSWDVGIGLGMLIGGVLSEQLGYHTAFWTSFVFQSLALIYTLWKVKPHFEANKLR